MIVMMMINHDGHAEEKEDEEAEKNHEVEADVTGARAQPRADGRR